MTPNEYLQKYRDEFPALKAWGEFIIFSVTNAIMDTHGIKQYNSWVKIPPTTRMKEEDSLIAKAFVLNLGWFSDPYNDIIDKVGVRFVVGLSDQIHLIASIIENSKFWHVDFSREFDQWKSADPRLFDYQSAHLVLESSEEIVHLDVKIPAGTKCEVQIRTLLQHAYAELSHDTLYKSNVTSAPEVHRLFAKSMALMETTDDMMLRAQQSSLAEMKKLDDAKEIVRAANNKYFPSLVFSNDVRENDFLIDHLRLLVDKHTVQDYDAFLKRSSVAIAKQIENNRELGPVFHLESIPFTYFLAKSKPRQMTKHWPFDRDFLGRISYDIGVVPQWEQD